MKFRDEVLMARRRCRGWLESRHVVAVVRARARALLTRRVSSCPPPPPRRRALRGKIAVCEFREYRQGGRGEEEEEEEEEEAAAEKGKRVLRAGKIIAKTASGQVRQHRQQRGAVSRATIPRRAAYPHL